MVQVTIELARAIDVPFVLYKVLKLARVMLEIGQILVSQGKAQYSPVRRLWLDCGGGTVLERLQDHKAKFICDNAADMLEKFFELSS
jgi:hypothetical protein